MTMKTVLKKETREAFGKKVYLLGWDKDGYTVWLEAPHWDCDWYWGFGYIERYTRKEGPPARDIVSHSHWASSIVGKQGETYIHHINENPEFVSTVLDDASSWRLSEYMREFYILKEMAAYCRYGAHISIDPAFVPQPEMEKKINAEILPALFKKIDALLSEEVLTAD